MYIGLTNIPITRRFQLNITMSKGITIKQSNRVTNSLRSFTLYQEKIFMCIMAQLQEAVELSFVNKDYRQLDLFQSQDIVVLDIPLKLISKPAEYSDVRDAILDMVEKTVTFRYIDKEGKAKIFKSSIFSADIPEKPDYKSIARLKMDKVVASYLIDIAKDSKGQPIQYTRYLLHTALNFKNKYSAKFYILLSSWKQKGQFYYSKNDLYTFLGIDEDKPFRFFKRDVLNKVHKELKAKSGDIYFEFTEVTGEARNVIGINIVVYNKVEQDKEYLTKVESIKSILSTHLSFKSRDIKDIEFIFEQDKFNYGLIIDKIQHINGYLTDPDNTIYNKVEYTKKALQDIYA